MTKLSTEAAKHQCHCAWVPGEAMVPAQQAGPPSYLLSSRGWWMAARGKSNLHPSRASSIPPPLESRTTEKSSESLMGPTLLSPLLPNPHGHHCWPPEASPGDKADGPIPCLVCSELPVPFTAWPSALWGQGLCISSPQKAGTRNPGDSELKMKQFKPRHSDSVSGAHLTIPYFPTSP